MASKQKELFGLGDGRFERDGGINDARRASTVQMHVGIVATVEQIVVGVKGRIGHEGFFGDAQTIVAAMNGQAVEECLVQLEKLI